MLLSFSASLVLSLNTRFLLKIYINMYGKFSVEFYSDKFIWKTQPFVVVHQTCLLNKIAFLTLICSVICDNLKHDLFIFKPRQFPVMGSTLLLCPQCWENGLCSAATTSELLRNPIATEHRIHVLLRLVNTSRIWIAFIRKVVYTDMVL